ncbi:MAG TPA: oxidoreductase, partial [Humibacillus sp.]|nr:oxidoreductase [Humibacillus sp.]
MKTPLRTVLVTAATLALLAGTASAYAAHAPSAAGRASSGAGATAYGWSLTPTGTTERFRGLAPVSSQVAWVSGTNGTVLRTTDGGASWSDVSPEGLGTEALQFRDIEAFDAQRAV